MIQLYFIGETALAPLLTPCRAKCAAYVVHPSPPCLTFEMEQE